MLIVVTAAMFIAQILAAALGCVEMVHFDIVGMKADLQEKWGANENSTLDEEQSSDDDD